jgi:trans-aconitate methyltransferase
MFAMASFYDDLAEWWPLFSPPVHYGEEAADILGRLTQYVTTPASTLLELGSGGGSLASHLKSHFRTTLTDRSPGMLAVSRQENPECEHLVADMRTARLGRRFDVVLIHDAIMYATTPAEVQACLATAAAHCAQPGMVIVLPDFVCETFEPGTEHGGEDADDGRAFRYLACTWDPDPGDHVYTVDYAFMMRGADGRVAVEHDRHVEGLFHRTAWLRWFAEAGLAAHSEIDAWGRNVFLARPVA